jgi:transcriptional regulator with XRE-family HTH domain
MAVHLGQDRLFTRTNRLAAYRIAARLTQEEVAGLLSKLSYELDGIRANVTAEMISRWERGARRPSRVYRRLLCALHDADELELGLRMPPVPAYSGDEYRSTGDEVKRREFLYYVAMFGGMTAIDLERMAQAFDRPAHASDRLMDDLHRIALSYARDAHVQAPGTLLPAVTGHLACLERLLRAPQPDSAGRRLRIIAGESAALAGWLAYLLDSNQTAMAHYSTAESLATEAGDGRLRAHALTLRSWLYSSISRRAPGDSPLTAITLLDEAILSAGRQAEPVFQAWIRARRAQQHAARDNGPAADRDLEVIGTLLAQHCDRPADGFLAHWRPEARLASSRGKCALFLRQPDAVTILEGAFTSTDPRLTAQRSALGNDIAAACLRRHDPDVDRACALLRDSVTLARQVGAAQCIQHARDVRRLMDRWHRSPSVRVLDELMRDVTAA